jgi:DNA-binding response OmpR family regulator
VLTILEDAQPMHALEAALMSKGFRIVRARHAMHGVWVAITGSPDLILTDEIGPSDESNYLLDCLKRNPRTATIPVISLVESLKQMEPSVSRLGELAACYLKSTPVEELVVELDRQIAGRAAHSAAPETSTDASRFDAYFAELGHSSPKAPLGSDLFFGNGVIDPAPVLFPTRFRNPQVHTSSAVRPEPGGISQRGTEPPR